MTTDHSPWDVDRPQPAIRRLVEVGAFSGSVLDVDCGYSASISQLAPDGIAS